MYPLDPDRLQLPESAVKMPAKRKRLPRHQPGEEFLRGPIPIAWLGRACQLPGKTLAVAVALWFKAGMTKSQEAKPVKATGSLLRRFGVLDRKTGYRALEALESAGLVSVDRHCGRCPRVTIQDVPEGTKIGE